MVYNNVFYCFAFMMVYNKNNSFYEKKFVT